MKASFLVLFLAAASLAAQQQAPATSPAATSQVTGHVSCSDTGKPARFASIQLVSEQSAKTPMFDPATIAAMVGGGSDKDDSKSKDDAKDKVDFGALLSQSLSAVMKGSNLSAMTTLEGSFSLDKVPPGTYYVIPQLAGYLSPIGQFSQMERMEANDSTLAAIKASAQKVVVQPGAALNIDIQLERGGAIAGVVHYDDGTPAPGVNPILMSLGADGKWKDLPPATMLPPVTDDRGHYRFSGLPAGKYAVRAALPTVQASMGIGAGSVSMHMNMGDALEVYSGDAVWKKDVKPVELAAGESRDDIDIAFPIGGLHVVSGTVVAKADGHPVNMGMVELQDPADKTVKLRTTMIGKDGSFQFNYVPDGAYRLQVTGAADMEGAVGVDSSNPLSMILSGKMTKPTREYGEAGINLSLPGSSEGLTVQLPDAAK